MPIRRIKSMDSARGIASFFLAPAHYSHWYLSIIPNPSWMQWLFRAIIGSTFQYVFVTLPGMSVTLQMYIARSKGFDEKQLRTSILKRGLVLIIIQFICNYFTYEPHFVWSWFILSFIGISIIMSYFLTDSSQIFRIILITIIIIISPFLKSIMLGFYLNEVGLNDPWSVGTFFYKMFLDVNFPILPYLTLPIFGTIYAQKMIQAIESGEKEKFAKNSIIIGVILTVFYLLTLDLSYFFNYPHIPFLSLPTRQDVIFAFGFMMLVNGILFYIQDIKGKNWRIFRLLEIFGAISLTVFITHFYIFPPIFEYIYDPIHNLSEYSVFQICSFFWAVYWIYGVLWDRYDRKYSLEWVLRKLG